MPEGKTCGPVRAPVPRPTPAELHKNITVCKYLSTTYTNELEMSHTDTAADRFGQSLVV